MANNPKKLSELKFENRPDMTQRVDKPIGWQEGEEEPSRILIYICLAVLFFCLGWLSANYEVLF